MKNFKFKQWLFFFTGVSIFILGIYSIFNPTNTVLLTTTVVAASMFIKGISNAISFFKQESGQKYSGLILFGALIDIIFGAILLMNPGVTAVVACLIVGFWFLVSSVFGISRSFEYKALGLKTWWISLVTSTISTVIALYTLGNPLVGGIVITYFVSIVLISIGVVVIADAFNN